MSYHHGDLRRALLDRTAEIVREKGVAAVTFRGLAADLGVSHTAPAHHFGTRQGLLSAFAAEGFHRLAASMDGAAGGAFLDVGLAYVQFALDNPAHFAVMFDEDSLDAAQPDLARASEHAFAILRSRAREFGGQGDKSDVGAMLIASWGMMHGIASLALGGSLDAARVRDIVEHGDVLAIARRAGMMLRRPEAG